jgi:hypothetical protein
VEIDRAHGRTVRAGCHTDSPDGRNPELFTYAVRN